MALNKIILQKLKEKTQASQNIQSFLLDIFQYESTTTGWYQKKYKDLLESHIKEDEDK